MQNIWRSRVVGELDRGERRDFRDHIGKKSRTTKSDLTLAAVAQERHGEHTSRVMHACVVRMTKYIIYELGPEEVSKAHETCTSE